MWVVVVGVGEGGYRRKSSCFTSITHAPVPSEFQVQHPAKETDETFACVPSPCDDQVAG